MGKVFDWEILHTQALGVQALKPRRHVLRVGPLEYFRLERAASDILCSLEGEIFLIFLLMNFLNQNQTFYELKSVVFFLQFADYDEVFLLVFLLLRDRSTRAARCYRAQFGTKPPLGVCVASRCSFLLQYFLEVAVKLGDLLFTKNSVREEKLCRLQDRSRELARHGLLEVYRAENQFHKIKVACF